MQLPEQYIVNKFYQFAGNPKYNRIAKTYQASCPICREGTSWLKKRRLYYVPAEGNIYCHNCGWSSSAYKWIREVTGLTKDEILSDCQEFDTFDANSVSLDSPPVPVPSLPGDCVNLFSEAQGAFYKENKDVQLALEYVKQRRLDTAVNRPDTLYLCFDKNKIHDKRLIIPFFNAENKIVFYQSRSIRADDTRPKYLSKLGSERALFNLNKLDAAAEHAYVFEGPINSFFVKNSIAVGGIQENSHQLFSSLQKTQIDMYCKFYTIVWILDSQWIDEASYKKTKKLIEMDQRVFIWPEIIGKKYKDFNDICIDLQLNEITEEFILRYSYQGKSAQDQYEQITCNSPRII